MPNSNIFKVINKYQSLKKRKLKCLIRKKMEVLQKELPLLSKLLRNEVSSFADISNTTELAPPNC